MLQSDDSRIKMKFTREWKWLQKKKKKKKKKKRRQDSEECKQGNNESEPQSKN